MSIAAIPPCPYHPGQLSSYTFMRAGQGWDYHQGPILHPFADDRILMCVGAYDIQECNNDGVVLYSVSTDEGESWADPQVSTASPSSVISHLQFADMGKSAEAPVVYGALMPEA